MKYSEIQAALISTAKSEDNQWLRADLSIELNFTTGGLEVTFESSYAIFSWMSRWEQWADHTKFYTYKKIDGVSAALIEQSDIPAEETKLRGLIQLSERKKALKSLPDSPETNADLKETRINIETSARELKQEPSKKITLTINRAGALRSLFNIAIEHRIDLFKKECKKEKEALSSLVEFQIALEDSEATREKKRTALNIAISEIEAKLQEKKQAERNELYNDLLQAFPNGVWQALTPNKELISEAAIKLQENLFISDQGNQATIQPHIDCFDASLTLIGEIPQAIQWESDKEIRRYIFQKLLKQTNLIFDGYSEKSLFSIALDRKSWSLNLNEGMLLFLCFHAKLRSEDIADLFYTFFSFEKEENDEKQLNILKDLMEIEWRLTTEELFKLDLESIPDKTLPKAIKENIAILRDGKRGELIEQLLETERTVSEFLKIQTQLKCFFASPIDDKTGLTEKSNNLSLHVIVPKDKTFPNKTFLGQKDFEKSFLSDGYTSPRDLWQLREYDAENFDFIMRVNPYAFLNFLIKIHNEGSIDDRKYTIYSLFSNFHNPHQALGSPNRILDNVEEFLQKKRENKAPPFFLERHILSLAASQMGASIYRNHIKDTISYMDGYYDKCSDVKERKEITSIRSQIKRSIDSHYCNKFTHLMKEKYGIDASLHNPFFDGEIGDPGSILKFKLENLNKDQVDSFLNLFFQTTEVMGNSYPDAFRKNGLWIESTNPLLVIKLLHRLGFTLDECHDYYSYYSANPVDRRAFDLLFERAVPDSVWSQYTSVAPLTNIPRSIGSYMTKLKVYLASTRFGGAIDTSIVRVIPAENSLELTFSNIQSATLFMKAHPFLRERDPKNPLRIDQRDILPLLKAALGEEDKTLSACVQELGLSPETFNLPVVSERDARPSAQPTRRRTEMPRAADSTSQHGSFSITTAPGVQSATPMSLTQKLAAKKAAAAAASTLKLSPSQPAFMSSALSATAEPSATANANPSEQQSETKKSTASTPKNTKAGSQ